jgi:N-formylglutamate deformylase
MDRYPFLVSVPHGGIDIPDEVQALLALSPVELRYYSDPATRIVYHFRDKVESYRDTSVSRMIVDLNRPPTSLPPKHPDGVVKTQTVHGNPVYSGGMMLDITLTHRLLMAHYFPYHADLDTLLEPGRIALGLDCHSMLPIGPPSHRDAGMPRPQVCLGNNGDQDGRQRPGTLATCPAEWITALAVAFQEEIGAGAKVAINSPFSGGFISNAHYWHRGIPWIQIEVNREFYETGSGEPVRSSIDQGRARETGMLVWRSLGRFWDGIREENR